MRWEKKRKEKKRGKEKGSGKVKEIHWHGSDMST